MVSGLEGGDSAPSFSSTLQNLLVLPDQNRDLVINHKLKELPKELPKSREYFIKHDIPLSYF